MILLPLYGANTFSAAPRSGEMDIRRSPTRAGTRFLLFPAYFENIPPEIITVTTPAGSIGPGPSDPTIYVANAINKETPYDPPIYVPPYTGATYAPTVPDADGNFDYIAPGTPQFLAAHLYGTMRHTLDVWHLYLQRRIVWWHVDEHPRIELIPVVRWQNAQSGPGFLETGLWPDETGELLPFALNFDVIAHETGHTILFSLLGVPRPEMIGVPFLAFHESFSDLVGLIGVLGFDSVVERLLQETNGNLYVLNVANRLSETSVHSQLRLASNETTMADVMDIILTPDGRWLDRKGLGRNQHAIAEPLTGAIFDVLVELFQDRLASEGVIPPELDARGWTREDVERSFLRLDREMGRVRRIFHADFVSAIQESRDLIGHAMAHVMLTMHPDSLTFGKVAARFIEAILGRGLSALLPALLAHFLYRGIDPTPFLEVGAVATAPRRWTPGRRSANWLRARRPGAADRCCDPYGFIFARSLMRHPHREAPPEAEN
jgi:hypothetical protein